MARQLFSFRRMYLVIYNWSMFLGWLQVLHHAANQSREHSVYAVVKNPLLLTQSAAVLEILHSWFQIVRSPVLATFLQVNSRLWITWGILYSFTEIQNHFFVGTMVISWSITEVIRYSFFGCKEAFGFAPSWLLWMRYTTFLVLYPAGLVSEVGLVYEALPYLRESDKYCVRMPNKWNFSFDYYYFALVFLVCYIPGFPFLYGYMLGQRKKAIARTTSKTD